MQRATRIFQLPSPLRQRIINTSTRNGPAVQNLRPWLSSTRSFSTTAHLQREDSAAEKAKKLNQKGLDEQEKELKQDDGFDSQIDNAIGEQRELQRRTPWHREGSDKPPVRRRRSAGAMTKGVIIYRSRLELR